MHRHTRRVCLGLPFASLLGSTYQPSQVLGHWMNLPPCYCWEEELSSPLCGYSYTPYHIYLNCHFWETFSDTPPKQNPLEPSMYAGIVFPPEDLACGFLPPHSPASSCSTELLVYKDVASARAASQPQNWWQSGGSSCFKGLRSYKVTVTGVSEVSYPGTCSFDVGNTKPCHYAGCVYF